MELTAQKERAIGENGPATTLELRTYALSWSFSNTSHGDRSRSLVPHRPYVLVTGVPLSSNTSDLRLEAGTVWCDGSRLSGA